MPFNVLPEEWEKVLAFFRKNPDAMKYSKKIHHAMHSFVKLIVDEPAITDSIFAIANKKYDDIRRLGKGSYGKVKRVKNRANMEFALKIEEGDEKLALKSNDDPSLQAARKVGFFKGQGLRILEPSLYVDEIRRKRYSLLELIEGETLFDIIRSHQRKPFLTTLQLHLIGLVCSLRILELHEQRIVHADIKPENIRGQVCGHKIFLKPLDYDFALILRENHTGKTVFEPKGSVHYAAPELGLKGRFSYASDVYALGVIFKYIDLNDLSQLMTLGEPEQRLPLLLVISTLLDKIIYKDGPLDQDAKEITSYALMKTASIGIFPKNNIPTLDIPTSPKDSSSNSASPLSAGSAAARSSSELSPHCENTAPAPLQSNISPKSSLLPGWLNFRLNLSERKDSKKEGKEKKEKNEKQDKKPIFS